MSLFESPLVGTTIDEATLTFVRTIVESETQLASIQILSLNRFVRIFQQQWKPPTIYDDSIQPNDQDTLNFIFAISPMLSPPTPTGSNSATTTTKDFGNNKTTATDVPHYAQVFHATLQQHRQTIATAVQSFNQSLENGRLTIEELQAASISLNSSTWDSYNAYCNHILLQSPTTTSFNRNECFHFVPLPSLTTIICEMNKLEDLKRTIQQYVSVCIEGKMYSLGDYDFPVYSRGQTTRRIDIKEKICTRELQQQLKNIQGVIGTNPNFLYWYAYFTLHPSILMPSAIVTLPMMDQPGKHGSFDLNVRFKRIRDAFGPTMTYEGVGTVLQLFLKTKANYNTEMKVLLNCQILHVSACDVTHFRAVKLLHEIKQPLQDYIQSCVWNQFQVVEHDPSFTELQTMVHEFYSSKSHDRQSCFDFFHRLYCILCTTGIDSANITVVGGPYIVLLYKINQLKLVMADHVWMPIKYICHASKLRNYFRDRQWLTIDDEYNNNEGIQKFHQDYETLINILRSMDAADELMIVDALGPVVRLFFYVERYSKCPLVYELVSRQKNDHDMQQLLKETATIQNDIHYLNGRIYSLQDLFQNVCDPLAPPTITCTSRLQMNYITTTSTPDVISSHMDATKP